MLVAPFLFMEILNKEGVELVISCSCAVKTDSRLLGAGTNML